MGRENKKADVAEWHRARILRAAEALFAEKGFEQVSVQDIAAASGYSRRTLYAYYEGKEALLLCIVESALLQLKQGVLDALDPSKSFLAQYAAVCAAMRAASPYALSRVDQAKTGGQGVLSDTEGRIMALGTEINALLATLIECGQASGAVRPDVSPMMTVYVLFSGMAALMNLVRTKGPHIARQFSLSEDDFLDYGFSQLINGILTTPVCARFVQRTTEGQL